MRKLSVLLIILLIVSCEYKVVRCKDADTYVLDNKEVVRLAECDGIELHQFMGDKAKSFADSVLLHQKVTIQRKGKDKYGRTLAVVLIGDDSMADLLVSNGYAWVYEKYKPNEEISNRFRYARYNHVGVFKYGNPISPAEFRRKK